MNSNTALAVIIVGVSLCITAAYSVNHLKLVPSNEHDVEIAKIEAAREKQSAEDHSLSSHQELMAARQKCVADIKSSMGPTFAANSPELFERMVNQTCH